MRGPLPLCVTRAVIVCTTFTCSVARAVASVCVCARVRPHAQAPLTHRLEALRAFLSAELGEAAFLSVYRHCARASKAELRARIEAAVGHAHARLAPVVAQLLQLEAEVY